MIKRREFIKQLKKNGLLGLAYINMPFLSSCLDSKSNFHFKISLLQNSFEQLFKNGLNILSFAQKAKEWGFEGVEYSSKYYIDNIDSNDVFFSTQQLAKRLREESERHKQKSLVINVTDEGFLASREEKAMTEAIERHKKWIDAASLLGCHSISVELLGESEIDAWQESATKGLTKLCEYANNQNINVLATNHGHYSSIGPILASVVFDVGKENCGTLPNFSDYCVNKNDDDCFFDSDRYKGFKALLRFAKSIHASSHDFDKNGKETTIDYTKMMEQAKSAYYHGYISVDYRGNGNKDDAEQNILQTKALLESTIDSIS